jgi:DNA mismatch repair ATPase MutS
MSTTLNVNHYCFCRKKVKNNTNLRKQSLKFYQYLKRLQVKDIQVLPITKRTFNYFNYETKVNRFLLHKWYKCQSYLCKKIIDKQLTSDSLSSRNVEQLFDFVESLASHALSLVDVNSGRLRHVEDALALVTRVLVVLKLL